ncbi:MAG TPA: hypothetical protein P5123_04400 [Spirochaetota bacterium]|nr:hypothetical protein [Spirochaetota bacterium]
MRFKNSQQINSVSSFYQLIRLLIIFMCLLMFFSYNISADDWGDSNASCIDLALVMRAYDITDFSTFDSSAYIGMIKPDVAKIVGAFANTPSIDTPEELLTALFYSSILPSDDEKKETILQQISQGSAGARKIAALWFKKGADKSESFEKAIIWIAAKSSVPRDSLFYFYREAISETVSQKASLLLKNAPYEYFTLPAGIASSKKEHIVKVITDYYIDPVSSKEQRLIDSVNYFGKKGAAKPADMERFRMLVTLLADLSPDLKDRIEKKLR